MRPRITADPDGNVYIYLRAETQEAVARTVPAETPEGVERPPNAPVALLDLDEQGRVIGIELWGAPEALLRPEILQDVEWLEE